ncbi:MAG: helix-turn-helix transcriptional regulator [Clostridia bacterium]|nr:helix-turn-helix transcriptional regulator [Clostridia bacterium]
MHELQNTFFPLPSQALPFFIHISGITYKDKPSFVSRNCSKFYTFEYIIDGSGIVEENGQISAVSKGDMYILHKGSQQKYYSDENDPWEKIWFNVDGTIIQPLLKSYNLSQTIVIKDIDIYPLFKEFFDITSQKSTKSYSKIFDETAAVFLKIIQKASNYIQKASIVNPEAAKLKKYIDAHYNEKITIEDLSKIIFRSPAQVNRIFKSEYGITPYNYMLDRKIETAKYLLETTGRSISTIAFQLNFTDEHYFSTYFKKRVGTSPKDYRKNNPNL